MPLRRFFAIIHIGDEILKKDIFNGKIKKEYFSYIFVYMIFFVMLFVAVGTVCAYASIWGMKTNTSGERLLVAVLGVIAFLLAFVYLFLELLVVRRFPKYKKLRRILFNSDIYFTDSTSNEYFGGSRTIRGRMYRAAFEIVTAFAEVEKRMGDKKPVRYTVYSALVLFMGVLGLVILLATPLLFDNGTIFSNMSDDVFLLCWIFAGVVCIGLDIFFLTRAINVGIMAPLENDKWRYDLYTSLVDIAVRKNNKKLKFWYNIDQLEQIENLVKSASENAELKLETKGNKVVSFAVIDTMNNSVIFAGLFM